LPESEAGVNSRNKEHKILCNCVLVTNEKKQDKAGIGKGKLRTATMPNANLFQIKKKFNETAFHYEIYRRYNLFSLNGEM
jgi:hypothetical protein